MDQILDVRCGAFEIRDWESECGRRAALLFFPDTSAPMHEGVYGVLDNGWNRRHAWRRVTARPTEKMEARR